MRNERLVKWAMRLEIRVDMCECLCLGFSDCQQKLESGKREGEEGVKWHCLQLFLPRGIVRLGEKVKAKLSCILCRSHAKSADLAAVANNLPPWLATFRGPLADLPFSTPQNYSKGRIREGKEWFDTEIEGNVLERQQRAIRKIDMFSANWKPCLMGDRQIQPSKPSISAALLKKGRTNKTRCKLIISTATLTCRIVVGH